MRQRDTPNSGTTAEQISRRSDAQKCPCRMPMREEILQVRPGSQWRATVQIVQITGQWLLLPTRGLDHAHLKPRYRVLRLAINTLGYPFLWPTAVLGTDDSRQVSLRQLLNAAEHGWGRAEYAGGRWRFEPATCSALPAWPDASLDELAISAFPSAMEYLRRQGSGARS